MKQQTNGIMLKITLGVLVTVSLATIAGVWRAAGIAGNVTANCKVIEEIRPVVHSNEIAIELFRKDIERILTKQEAMIKKSESNTALIIEAIKNGN